MTKREIIDNLSALVRAMVASGVKDNQSCNDWKRENEALMERLLCYKRKEGMPSVTTLVKAAFHPELPLVMLGYTSAAHNLLHAFDKGWTMPIRYCRGIVFTKTGELKALPLPKFFNYGEHKTTRNLPNKPFLASKKEDGHLGIIFEHEGDVLLTTRGVFKHHTAEIGNELIREYMCSKGWRSKFPKDITLLVEVIDPSTKVHVDYGRQRKFVVLQAFNRCTLKKLSRRQVEALAKKLDLPVAEARMFSSLDEMLAEVADISKVNQEGWVAEIDDKFVKFKYQNYINLMVISKLSYKYLMARIISGNLEKMIGNLPEEVLDKAREMVCVLENVMTISDPNPKLQEKLRRQYLYDLYGQNMEKVQEASYKTTCRDYLRFLESAQS